MPCKKCKDGKYKWGNTGECKYSTKEACEKSNHKKYNKMQPTPLGKKTYEEYAKELKEFNLSKAERVELNAMDDLDKLAKKMTIAEDNMLKQLKKTDKEIFDAKSDLREVSSENNKLVPDMTKLMSNVEKAAKELGVKIDVSKYQTVINSFIEARKKISNYLS